MHRLKQRRLKKRIALSEISLTPLIDTALTLLVIFMVTSPLMHNAIKITLPKGQVKEDAGLQQDIEIYVDKEGRIFCDGSELLLDDLVAILQQKITLNQEKTVYVRADTAVSYGQVIELVDHIKAIGGIKYVALATQKNR